MASDIKKLPKPVLTHAQEQALVLKLKRAMETKEKITIVEIQDSISDYFISNKFPVDPEKKISTGKAYGFLKKHNVLKDLFWSKKFTPKEPIIIEKDDNGLHPFSYKDIPSPPRSDDGNERIQALEEKIEKLEKSLDKYNKLFEALAKKNESKPVNSEK